MALKNWKIGTDLSTSAPNTVIDEVSAGERAAMTSLIIHNPHTSDVLVSAEIYDGFDSYQFLKETLTPNESFYYDVKMILNAGDRIRVSTDHASTIIIASGDEA